MNSDYNSGVRYLSPAGAIEPTGTWSLASRAGDCVFVAGMRGIDPATNELVTGDEARIRQAFKNMAHIAASEGASLADAVRLTVYVTDMERYRPIVKQGAGRTVVGRPLPAAHDPRSRRPRRRRYLRGRGNVLRAGVRFELNQAGAEAPATHKAGPALFGAAVFFVRWCGPVKPVV